MLATVVRVLAGFVLAALAAAAATVSFVVTPAELAGFAGRPRPELPGHFLMLTLLAATHSAIFAAPFAIITAIIGEWQRIRGLAYYLVAGVLIGLGGFAAQLVSETGGPATIANNYAVKAFLTAGFVGGLVYWMAAGRSAGGRDGAHRGAQDGKLPRLKVDGGDGGSRAAPPRDAKTGASDRPAAPAPAPTGEAAAKAAAETKSGTAAV